MSYKGGFASPRRNSQPQQRVARQADVDERAYQAKDGDQIYVCEQCGEPFNVSKDRHISQLQDGCEQLYGVKANVCIKCYTKGVDPNKVMKNRRRIFEMRAQQERVSRFR